MTPLEYIILLVAGGVVLLVAEALLPTHGLLGILGLFCLLAGVGVVFTINRWVGVAVSIAGLVASPFIAQGAFKLWTITPIGKRLILQPVSNNPKTLAVTLGQHGVAVTELRPIGECEFDDHRVESLSELGLIRPGQAVKVVAIENGRPTVRAINA